MGRNARKRAQRKAEIKVKGRGAPQGEPTLLMTWGIPGVGKTTFANWLVKERGFARVDSDYPNVARPLDRSWAAARQGAMTPAAFVAEARRHGKVVVELGIWARPPAFEFLRGFVEAGARTWWFDGDREEAFTAWRRDSDARGMDAGVWERVVAVIRQNWQLVEDFFGPRIVRTIEAGPVHVPPEQTYGAIFGA